MKQNMLGIAIAMASEAFKYTVDKGGEPYIMHCLRVMNAVKHLGEDVMCAAVMHDLVEDTLCNLDILKEVGSKRS
jgi:(p)ppGpp synthase/HD superfamily hydrolase